MQDALPECAKPQSSLIKYLTLRVIKFLSFQENLLGNIS